MLKTVQNFNHFRRNFTKYRSMSKHAVLDFHLNDVQSIIPQLTSKQHKGEAGRIGIIGGSREYTGAPYFSAITALRLGADLAHVFCSRDAGTAIKCYSPDLIVHPILNDSDAFEQLENWLQRLHVVVIGPGLGRDDTTVELSYRIIQKLKSSGITTIIDADGMHVLTKFPDLMENFSSAVVTPNEIEFQRLCSAVSIEIDEDADFNFSQRFKNVTVVRKGAVDKIFNSAYKTVAIGGSNRRCGGQGDILSGAIAVFSHWAEISKTEHKTLLAGYGACRFTKKLNEVAFVENDRGMITNDMVAKIPSVFRQLFEKV